MVCPFCGRIKTSVTNSRYSNRRGQVWRRRQCERCGRLFTTREYVEIGSVEVLKRNGKKQPFARAKLLRSVILCTDHLEDADAAFALVETIESKLLKNLDARANTINSEDIATTTLNTLKRFNTAAYVKYLSYQDRLLDERTLIKQMRRR